MWGITKVWTAQKVLELFTAIVCALEIICPKTPKFLQAPQIVQVVLKEFSTLIRSCVCQLGHCSMSFLFPSLFGDTATFVCCPREKNIKRGCVFCWKSWQTLFGPGKQNMVIIGTMFFFHENLNFPSTFCTFPLAKICFSWDPCIAEFWHCVAFFQC